MSLKWIFALLVVTYTLNVFATELQLSNLIEESYQEQIKLAAEIQHHLGVRNEKTLGDRSASAVSPEGFNIVLRNNPL
jgi:hypothetical protein